jgi:hypothetical protein
MIGGIRPEEYDELCRRLGAVLQDATPAQATIAVVSKGDPRLVEIDGREGRHFPGDVEGRYAGYHPRTSEEAISLLEEARRSGAQFLCLPATSFWWLEHYQGLTAWLGTHCRVVAEDAETCRLYDLVRIPAAAAAEDRFSAVAQVRALLDSLLPAGAVVYAVGLPADGLAAPGRTVTPVPPTSVFGLRRRLEGGAGRPTFLLLRNDAGAPLDPELERSLDSWARPIARRKDLCDIFQVTAGLSRSRLSRSPRDGDSASGSSRALGGEAADKLSSRLERLGLPGQDGGSS